MKLCEKGDPTEKEELEVHTGWVVNKGSPWLATGLVYFVFVSSSAAAGTGRHEQRGRERAQGGG